MYSFSVCVLPGEFQEERQGSREKMCEAKRREENLRMNAGKENLYRKLDLKNAEILGALLGFKKSAEGFSLCKSRGRR